MKTFFFIMEDKLIPYTPNYQENNKKEGSVFLFQIPVAHEIINTMINTHAHTKNTNFLFSKKNTKFYSIHCKYLL
jgi:hypothetical protein